MPKEVLDAYNEALRRKEIDEPERMRKIERYLDKGHGACWLRQPAVAELIEENILHFDGERYRLIAWCVMPNHVHVLVETVAGYSLEDLAHSWKSYTAHEANLRIGRRGTFWQREVFDRYMRSEAHFNRTLFYIHWNPVQANLVDRPENWRFSSARMWEESDSGPAHRLEQDPQKIASGPRCNKLHASMERRRPGGIVRQRRKRE
jgi:REP element-mobilizing transposase RayT